MKYLATIEYSKLTSYYNKYLLLDEKITFLNYLKDLQNINDNCFDMNKLITKIIFYKSITIQNLKFHGNCKYNYDIFYLINEKKKPKNYSSFIKVKKYEKYENIYGQAIRFFKLKF